MIVQLGPADAAWVAELDAALFGKAAWSPQAWTSEARADDPHRRYVVLRRDGAPVGYAGILRTGSDADVLTVAVAADHQGQGCGRLLLQELLRIAQGWNSRAVYLEVEEGNAAALALYRGSGFEPVGQRRHYYGPDRHAVTMRRQLREPMGSIPLGGGR